MQSSIVVRRSKVHGLGVFATRAIRKGEVIDEYVGERISHAEANWRYRHRDFNDTECPGDVLYAMLPQLRKDVAARM